MQLFFDVREVVRTSSGLLNNARDWLEVLKSLKIFLQLRLSSEVVGKSSEVVGNIRRSSEVFRNLRQSSEDVDEKCHAFYWKKIGRYTPAPPMHDALKHPNRTWSLYRTSMADSVWWLEFEMRNGTDRLIINLCHERDRWPRIINILYCILLKTTIFNERCRSTGYWPSASFNLWSSLSLHQYNWAKSNKKPTARRVQKLWWQRLSEQCKPAFGNYVPGVHSANYGQQYFI